MSPEQTPACPWCKTDKHVYAHGAREWWCSQCKRIFDPVDDGDFGYTGPERVAERREEFKLRQQARKGTRR